MRFIQIAIYMLVLKIGLTAQNWSVIGNGGSNGEISYTLGQVFVNSNCQEDIHILEGFQQAEFIHKTDGFEETVEVVVFPNPVIDNVYFKNTHLLKCGSMFDSSGKRLIDFDGTAFKEGLNLTRFPAGIYYLNLFTKEEKIISVKILHI